jgi:flagellar protein FlgJ
MTTPVGDRHVYTDFQGLSELRARARDNGEQALREVAGQFEALFIQMMLKSMRDAGLGEGLLDGEHTRTYQAMFDKQISVDLGKRQGLGLAEMMVRQLSRSDADGSAAGPAPSSPTTQLLNGVAPAATVASAPTPVAGGADREWRPDSPREFVSELWPHAERAAREVGTVPEALIAQAALETGWGKHVMKRSDGSSSFNLFGIKADSRWQGERVTSETVEFRDGLVRKERASFRAYASLAESFQDYVDFLRANPRYDAALMQSTDGPGFVRELARAGYATDPDYARKINQIMSDDGFRDSVSAIKESVSEPLS